MCAPTSMKNKKAHLRCVALHLSIFAARWAILFEEAVVVAAESSRTGSTSTGDPVEAGRGIWEERDEHYRKEQRRLLATRLTHDVFLANENTQISEEVDGHHVAAKQKQAAEFWRGAEVEEAAASVLAQIKQSQDEGTGAAQWAQTETEKMIKRTGGDLADDRIEMRDSFQQQQQLEEIEPTSAYNHATSFTAKGTAEEPPGSPGTAVQFLEAGFGERLPLAEGQQEQHRGTPSNTKVVRNYQPQKVQGANSVPTSAEDGTEAGDGFAWQQKVERLEDVVSELGEIVRHLRKELATQQVFQNTTAARIASAGAVSEIIQQNQIAHSLANMRRDFLVMLVLLLLGYGAVVIGLLLPTKLVFFPPVLYLPTPENPSEDVLDHSEQQQTEDAADDALRKQRQRPLRKFMLLPHAFAADGTLSSVCQFQGSSAGNIWTSCLIVYAVCALLSRYTVIAGLYPHWCSGLRTWWHSASPLLNFSGISPLEMLLRVLWLVLPCVGFMLTAAVPSPTADARRAMEQESTKEAREAVPSSTKAEEDVKMRETETDRVQVGSHDAIEYFRLRNTRWQVVLHAVWSPLAMAVLVLFQTYQFTFGEGISLTAAIFGTMDEQLVFDDEVLHYWARHQALGVEGVCSPQELSLRVQWAPMIFRLRALFLVFSWIFCSGFAILVSLLPQRHDRERRPFSTTSTPIFLPYDGSASLLLPKISYVLEVAAILCVLCLPFFPVMYNLSFRFALAPGHVAEDYQQILIGSGENLRHIYNIFWHDKEEAPVKWREPRVRGPGFAPGLIDYQCTTSWGTHTWRDPSLCEWIPGWNQTENGTNMYFWDWAPY
ncbi:unnamed protein product [Amoebophrya sp. A120]|nr:unnamed protein product [Amoebophrya sp. A120]|eukprot:GSA120T00016652001.1